MCIADDWERMDTKERIDFMSFGDEKLKKELTKEAKEQNFL